MSNLQTKYFKKWTNIKEASPKRKIHEEEEIHGTKHCKDNQSGNQSLELYL